MAKQFVLIDVDEELAKLHTKLDAIITYMNAKDERVNTSKNEVKDWITVNDWCKLYSKSRGSWYKKYKYCIKHRTDPHPRIHVPSMEAYLLDKAITR